MSGKSVIRTLFLVVPAFALLMPGGEARAQGWGAPGREAGERKRPDRKRGGLEGRRPMGPPSRPGGEAPVPMQVSGGKLYIVTGSTIRKLDAKSLEEESTAVIQAAVDAEFETKAKERFMQRFDKDGDGFIREDEVPNPVLIKKLDKDGDGAIGIGEVPSAKMMMARRPSGPVSLLVEGENLYVYRDGWLYRYDSADLTLQAQNEVAPQRRPERPPGFDRGAERDKREKFRQKRRQKGAAKGDRGPPPPPELPDEPVKF